MRPSSTWSTTEQASGQSRLQTVFTSWRVTLRILPDCPESCRRPNFIAQGGAPMAEVTSDQPTARPPMPGPRESRPPPARVRRPPAARVAIAQGVYYLAVGLLVVQAPTTVIYAPAHHVA